MFSSLWRNDLNETHEKNKSVVKDPNKVDKPNGPIFDGYGRPITSLRLSVNRECNLSCFYCHKEGMVPEKRDMTAGEIEHLVRVGASLGINKVKLTGGELLLRPDVVEIVQRLSPLVKEVSITTNAIKLAELAKPLKAAGLVRVNISLHTIRHDTYRKICGSNQLDAALAGLDAAINAGLHPIKINMVLLKGINDQEISEMLAYAAEKGAILQLIELETDKHGDQKLKTPVEVELVMPMHNTLFCANCTRIRLTAGGYVKGCLFNKTNVIDVLGPLRNGADDRQLEELFMKVIKNRKPYWTKSDSDTFIKNEIRGEVN